MRVERLTKPGLVRPVTLQSHKETFQELLKEESLMTSQLRTDLTLENGNNISSAVMPNMTDSTSYTSSDMNTDQLRKMVRATTSMLLST